jgi:hypothetical protein
VTREEAEKMVEEIGDYPDGDHKSKVLEIVSEIYDSIVCCNECVYRSDQNTTQWCDKIQKVISRDWYCADFERMNND